MGGTAHHPCAGHAGGVCIALMCVTLGKEKRRVRETNDRNLKWNGMELELDLDKGKEWG